MAFKLNKTGNYFVTKLKVNNLSEFVEAVDQAEGLIDDDQTADVWFRGQPRTTYRLIPSVFRNNHRYDPKNESSEVT